MLSSEQVDYFNWLFENELFEVEENNKGEQDVRTYQSAKWSNFNSLREMEEKNMNGLSFAQNMHPNPIFYKYYWWIFSKYSQQEGENFLTKQNMLSTCEAMKLMQKLNDEGTPYIVYNKKCPRWGEKTPFDKNKNLDWAPDYDNDIDYSWEGHK